MHSSSDLALPTVHQPVLLQPVLDGLDIQPSDVVLDGTLGGGGHARAMAERLSSDGHIVGIDTDTQAIERAKKALESATPKVTLIHGNFRDMSTLLRDHGITHVNKILLDLGFSSDHIEIAGRGFSFKRDEPLLMTLSDVVTDDTLTARIVVNTWAEESLADIIFGWGGERYSRRIAKAIVEARKRAPIETSAQLVDIIERAVPAGYRHGKIHPATRTFQALRIAVNDELGALTEALDAACTLLTPGGRIAIITFHSLEDGIVKNTFRNWQKEEKGIVLTKKPIGPTEEELSTNRRARSAKVRIFQTL